MMAADSQRVIPVLGSSIAKITYVRRYSAIRCRRLRTGGSAVRVDVDKGLLFHGFETERVELIRDAQLFEYEDGLPGIGPGRWNTTNINSIAYGEGETYG